MNYTSKYNKYINKYKSVGGGKSYYNLSNTNFFCFSDEEGGAPFIFNSVSDDKGIPKILNDHFEFTDGIITKLKDNTSFAFLGDLVDNSNHSIRLLESFIRLKSDKPDNVILIGGNRDFNKVRMGIELYFEEDENKNLLQQ